VGKKKRWFLWSILCVLTLALGGYFVARYIDKQKEKGYFLEELQSTLEKKEHKAARRLLEEAHEYALTEKDCLALKNPLLDRAVARISVLSEDTSIFSKLLCAAFFIETKKEELIARRDPYFSSIESGLPYAVEATSSYGLIYLSQKPHPEAHKKVIVSDGENSLLMRFIHASSQKLIHNKERSRNVLKEINKKVFIPFSHFYTCKRALELRFSLRLSLKEKIQIAKDLIKDAKVLGNRAHISSKTVYIHLSKNREKKRDVAAYIIDGSENEKRDVVDSLGSIFWQLAKGKRFHRDSRDFYEKNIQRRIDLLSHCSKGELSPKETFEYIALQMIDPKKREKMTLDHTIHSLDRLLHRIS